MTRLAPTAFPIASRDVGRALANGLRTDFNDAEWQLRAALTARLDVAALYPVASGRTALALLLGVLQETGAETRREVILPAYTCPSLIKVILDARLKPRMVDISPTQLSFAPGALEAALGPQTLAVIFVHPFGLALDLRAAAHATRAAGAVLIEDAAQALGAVSRGRTVGTVGDYGIFSTGPGKPLAVGGGGFLTVNHRPAAATGGAPEGAIDELAERDAHLATAWQALPIPGGLRAAWSIVKLALVGLLFHPWGWRLAAAAGIARAGNSEAGQNYTMHKMTGPQLVAIGQLLDRWESANQRRRTVAHKLIAALDDVPGPTFPEPVFQEFVFAGATAFPPRLHPATHLSIYLRLPVLAPDEATRDAWVAALEQRGVGAGKMYGRTLAERFPQLGESPRAYPGAQTLARRLLTLPTHHFVRDSDPARMVAALQSVPG